MNPHPHHTGEYLAQQCLDQAGGDYSLAADALMAMNPSVRREHAMAALALWAAFAPIANDNEGPELK
jgi:hypothetical protein